MVNPAWKRHLPLWPKWMGIVSKGRRQTCVNQLYSNLKKKNIRTNLSGNTAVFYLKKKKGSGFWPGKMIVIISSPVFGDKRKVA